MNEYETIPAYTSIAGDTLDAWSNRDTITAMIKFLATTSSYDCSRYWQNVAECNDDDNELFDLQDAIAQDINTKSPLDAYCTVELQDNEWRVIPYIDDDLMCVDSNNHDELIVTKSHKVNGDSVKTAHYNYLHVNDHGNTDLMTWNEAKREYKIVWSIV